MSINELDTEGKYFVIQIVGGESMGPDTYAMRFDAVVKYMDSSDPKFASYSLPSDVPKVSVRISLQ